MGKVSYLASGKWKVGQSCIDRRWRVHKRRVYQDIFTETVAVADG